MSKTCKDIWKQTPAQRNYEFWASMCRILKRDATTYKPLVEAKKRRMKELEKEKNNE